MRNETITIVILFGLTGLLNLAEGDVGDDLWDEGCEEAGKLDGSGQPSSDGSESDTDEEPLGEFFLLKWLSPSDPEERAAREAEKERKRQEKEARKQAEWQKWVDDRCSVVENIKIPYSSSDVVDLSDVGIGAEAPVINPAAPVLRGKPYPGYYPSERERKTLVPIPVTWDNPGPDKVANMANALTTTVIEEMLVRTMDDLIDTETGKIYFKGAMTAYTVIKAQAEYGSAGVTAELPGIVLGFLTTPYGGIVYSKGKAIANSYYRDMAIEMVMNEDKYNRAPKRPFRSYDEYEEWVKKNNSDPSNKPMTVAEAKARLNAQMEKMGWWARAKELLCSGGYK
jgi:hypothetical protein